MKLELREPVSRWFDLGETVWWDDPDHGKSSGIYKVVSEPPVGACFNDAIVLIANDQGGEAEVLMQELTEPHGRTRRMVKDKRVWMAARAVCDIGVGKQNLHESFSSYGFALEQEPLLNIITNALMLARFVGHDTDELLVDASARFNQLIEATGEDDECSRSDESRNEWAHKLLEIFIRRAKGDGLDMMTCLARLADQDPQPTPPKDH
jgi:hypothetical protein